MQKIYQMFLILKHKTVTCTTFPSRFLLYFNFLVLSTPKMHSDAGCYRHQYTEYHTVFCNGEKRKIGKDKESKKVLVQLYLSYLYKEPGI